jgi:hypothetical protein
VPEFLPPQRPLDGQERSDPAALPAAYADADLINHLIEFTYNVEAIEDV